MKEVIKDSQPIYTVPLCGITPEKIYASINNHGVSNVLQCRGDYWIWEGIFNYGFTYSYTGKCSFKEAFVRHLDNALCGKCHIYEFDTFKEFMEWVYTLDPNAGE